MSGRACDVMSLTYAGTQCSQKSRRGAQEQLLMEAISRNPSFAANMTSIEVYEDFPVGETLFWIIVNNPTSATLTYGIGGPDAVYFNVIPSTGEVQLAFPLDYEVKAKRNLEIELSVSDNTPSSRPVTKIFFVIVLDCNDNVPSFLRLPYMKEIFENETVGSIIYDVSAVDIDSDGIYPVTYDIEEVIPNNQDSKYLFYITPNGSLFLNDTLNYNSKSTFYQVKVRATDKEGTLNNTLVTHSATAYVSLDIEDLPDIDPVFLKEPYETSVYENAVMNTPILTVSAIDGDKGINDNITYTIKNASEPGLFAIKSNTGEIYVSGAIDWEALGTEKELVRLEVEAQEENLNVKGQNATSRTTVNIRVLDVNDNKPQFYNCEMPDCDFQTLPVASHFIGEIEEHSSVRVPVSSLTITANDPDKGQNGAFDLYLQGPHAAYFSVSPSRGLNTALVQILVRDSAAIDYEKEKVMTLEIVANDTGFPQNCCSTASVTINLIDINDHTPEFDQTTYELSVLENCPNGTTLGIITATDLDSGDLGRITYQLLPESIHGTFQVNSTTGKITVVNGGLLDRERRSLYYATLQAKDGMNATGTTLLEITLLDENDEIPMAIGLYNVFVNENTDNVSIQIEAFDADEPNTDNSRIKFRFLPGDMNSNFTVNENTGLITSLAPLDRESIDIEKKGRIELIVELYDLGVPSLSSNVSIFINVEDLNDNGPIFNLSEYHFYVNESTKGAYIGGLEVTDRDQTEVNNRVSFRITHGGSGSFLIRAQQGGIGLYRGELFLDPEVELDYEQQLNITLIIEAQDNGLNGVINIASATAIVEVLDLNDEPPSVVPSPLQDVYLPENGTDGVKILTTLNAVDPDTDHELEFQQLNVQCLKNGNDVSMICEDWLWLAPTGDLYVNQTEDVDYELCNLVIITLRVEDKLTLLGDRYSKNVTQRVVIDDINDNSPEFSDIDETFVVVPDIAPIDYQVATVKATDNDSGPNAVITFSITSVEFILSNGEETRPLSNIFRIITSSENDIYLGSVRVASSLDVTLKGQYKVTVTATDGGTPSLSSTRALDIFAVDESYRVSLYFSSPADEVRDNSDSILRALTKATKSTGNGNPAAKQSNEHLYGIIAGLVGAILLILIIMITALLCMRKSHKRRLRAVKALRMAKNVNTEAVQGGGAIPGTNKFDSDRANPILNADLSAIVDLGFEEDSSTSDTSSINSLDDNTVDKMGGGASMLQMQDSTEAQTTAGTSKDSKGREEPLAAALNDRAKKGYTNSALDTTDL
ncbi:cadherin-related family member 2 [Discoglossus pictus]